MHFQCPQCQQVHASWAKATDCCPSMPNEIPDDAVLYCWRCRGDGCEACFDQGIMFAWEVRMRERWAAKLELAKQEQPTHA